MRLFLTISIISWTEARFYLTEVDITSQSPPPDIAPPDIAPLDIAPPDIAPTDFGSDYSDTADYSNQGKTKDLEFSNILMLQHSVRIKIMK